MLSIEQLDRRCQEGEYYSFTREKCVGIFTSEDSIPVLIGDANSSQSKDLTMPIVLVLSLIAVLLLVYRMTK